MKKALDERCIDTWHKRYTVYVLNGDGLEKGDEIVVHRTDGIVQAARVISPGIFSFAVNTNDGG